MQSVSELSIGEVGYIITGIKDIKDIKVGDTITNADNSASMALHGYREIKPMVFSGLYPIEGGSYEDLRDALEKLKLNDPSFIYEPESSKALGFGFRCGFLGLLHMEIIKERLEREYQLELLTTAPGVAYKVTKTDNSEIMVSNPADLPPLGNILKIEEPYVSAVVLVPSGYIGSVLELCQDKRGDYKDVEYLSENRARVHYHLPLGEILFDFFDLLKSKTKGYASFDYEPIGYKEEALVKLDVLLAGEVVDALSLIVHRDRAYVRGKDLVERLRKIIPRQMFEVPIQAAIGNNIIARETVTAKRKDVTSKCYGGDISRKRKLLQKQKEGKKKMKQLGKVEVPQEAFMAILRIGKEDKKRKT
jgi:GTP-binding protein LepA